MSFGERLPRYLEVGYLVVAAPLSSSVTLAVVHGGDEEEEEEDVSTSVPVLDRSRSCYFRWLFGASGGSLGDWSDRRSDLCRRGQEILPMRVRVGVVYLGTKASAAGKDCPTFRSR